MIANLLNVPRNPREWAIWSNSHRLDHDRIRDAIQQQQNVNLPTYPLDPIPSNQLTQWLEFNQQAHDDMLNQLGIQGSDLEGVDLTKLPVLSSWIYLHAQDHISARRALGI